MWACLCLHAQWRRFWHRLLHWRYFFVFAKIFYFVVSLADWKTVPNFSWWPKTWVSIGLRFIPLISTLFNWFLACVLDLKATQCPEACWHVGLLPICLLGRWRWKLVWGWAICCILTAFDFPFILTTDHLKWFSNDQKCNIDLYSLVNYCVSQSEWQEVYSVLWNERNIIESA